MDHVNLLFFTSCFSFVMMIPIWLLYDLPHIYAIENLKLHKLSTLLLFDGLTQFGQNIAAFTFMTKVTPLTYTVFNTFKRTFVIITSILYFGNSVNILNVLGIALTTVGVGLYNKAKLDLRTVK
jgi:multidrug transporter EmrE-like cation transporter